MALYWKTLVFGKTFRAVEWDLLADGAPEGPMHSVTIRVPSLVRPWLAPHPLCCAPTAVSGDQACCLGSSASCLWHFPVVLYPNGGRGCLDGCAVQQPEVGTAVVPPSSFQVVAPSGAWLMRHSVQGAVKTKIALASGIKDSSAIKQLALWVPGSGDFVVSPCRLLLPPIPWGLAPAAYPLQSVPCLLSPASAFFPLPSLRPLARLFFLPPASVLPHTTHPYALPILWPRVDVCGP